MYPLGSTPAPCDLPRTTGPAPHPPHTLWTGNPDVRYPCIHHPPQTTIRHHPMNPAMNAVLKSGPLLVLGALSLTALTPFAAHRTVSAFLYQSRTSGWDSTTATYVVPVPGQPRKVATSALPALPPPGSRLKPAAPIIKSAGNEPTTPYYTFTIDDQTYIGQRFDASHPTLTSSDLTFTHARQSETPIVVYYDHLNPNQAVIRAGARFSELWPALVSCFVLPFLTILSWQQIWILKRCEGGPMAGLPRFRLRSSTLDSYYQRAAA